MDSAAATATAMGVVVVAIAIVVDQEDEDDDEQDPGAVVTTEQIPQTHFVSPPFASYTIYYVWDGKGVTTALAQNFKKRRKTKKFGDIGR